MAAVIFALGQAESTADPRSIYTFSLENPNLKEQVKQLVTYCSEINQPGGFASRNTIYPTDETESVQHYPHIK